MRLVTIYIILYTAPVLFHVLHLGDIICVGKGHLILKANIVIEKYGDRE